jgi:hypothetical protein
MTLREMTELVSTLTVEERKQLVMAIMDSLAEESQPRTKRVLDFLGAGEPKDGNYTDADAYVRSLREEWDHRP